MCLSIYCKHIGAQKLLMLLVRDCCVNCQD